jgi:hypothetical protein
MSVEPPRNAARLREPETLAVNWMSSGGEVESKR